MPKVKISGNVIVARQRYSKGEVHDVDEHAANVILRGGFGDLLEGEHHDLDPDLPTFPELDEIVPVRVGFWARLLAFLRGLFGKGDK